MKMRRSCAAGAARAPDDHAALDASSDFDVEARQMRVVRSDAAAVIHDYHVSVTVIPAGKCDYTCLAGADRITPPSFDVHARMELRSPSERIAPVAETASKTHTRCGCGPLLILRFSSCAL